MNFTLLTTAIAAAVGGAAGFGLAWQLQAGNISEINLKAANERITIQRAARQTLERVTGQIATAQVAAGKRNVRIRTAARDTRDIAGGLRITTANTVRTAATDSAASSHAAAALGAVFDQCVGELTALGEIADRHASDIQLITDSWPKE